MITNFYYVYTVTFLFLEEGPCPIVVLRGPVSQKGA